MPPLRGDIPIQTSTGLFAEILSFIDLPAAIILDGDEVLVRNHRWMELTGGSADPGTRAGIDHELRAFTSPKMLLESLKQRQLNTGVVHITRVSAPPDGGEGSRHFELNWYRLATGAEIPSLELLVINTGSAANDPLRVIAVQREQIDRLLIRQSLIEESERRRLGQALHDVVAQDLAQIRSMALAKDFSACDTAPLIDRIDGVLKTVRSLGFELSPPILTDLGLCPALEWFAQHMSREHGASITVAEGSREPRLSPESRTIIFRAVRELVQNAVKHAKGSSVEIRCEGDDHTTRITVSDTGPGFDLRPGRSATRFINTYGLLSVEQQIRGLGGLFSVVSSVRHGTLAIITIDAEPERGN
jgi:signal transduction histidine kinase